MTWWQPYTQPIVAVQNVWTLRYCRAPKYGSLKVCPHYATQHTAAKCGKAAWQKLRYATGICGHCVGLAAAYRSMLCSLKIRSANCRSHQKKPRGIWWVRVSKWYQPVWEKKSDQVRRSRSTVLVTWRSAKNFFHVDAIALAAYVEQLLPHGRAAVCCILLRGIVWTHL